MRPNVEEAVPGSKEKFAFPGERRATVHLRTQKEAGALTRLLRSVYPCPDLDSLNYFTSIFLLGVSTSTFPDESFSRTRTLSVFLSMAISCAICCEPSEAFSVV